MRIGKLHLRVLIILGCLAGAIAWTSAPKKSMDRSILGTWALANSDYRFTLSEDETLTWFLSGQSNQGQPESTQWWMDDSHRIHIFRPDEDTPHWSECEYEIVNDQLKISDDLIPHTPGRTFQRVSN